MSDIERARAKREGKKPPTPDAFYGIERTFAARLPPYEGPPSDFDYKAISAEIDRIMSGAQEKWSRYWFGPPSENLPVEPREAVTPGTQERQSSLDGGAHEKP